MSFARRFQVVFSRFHFFIKKLFFHINHHYDPAIGILIYTVYLLSWLFIAHDQQAITSNTVKTTRPFSTADIRSFKIQSDFFEHFFEGVTIFDI